MYGSEDRPKWLPSGRRVLAPVVLASALTIGILAAVVALRPPEIQPPRRISEAGLDNVEFILVGGSRVRVVETGQLKESSVVMLGGRLRGEGLLVRVANQLEGEPIECLGKTYDDPRYWTSSTSATGQIEFRDALTFKPQGSIMLTVEIVEVVLRPMAVDPLCQSVTGTYSGNSGALIGMEGTVTAGFLPGEIPQFWTFDDDHG